MDILSRKRPCYTNVGGYIENLVTEDRHSTCHDIENVAEIGSTAVETISHKQLPSKEVVSPGDASIPDSRANRYPSWLVTPYWIAPVSSDTDVISYILQIVSFPSKFLVSPLLNLLWTIYCYLFPIRSVMHVNSNNLIDRFGEINNWESDGRNKENIEYFSVREK